MSRIQTFKKRIFVPLVGILALGLIVFYTFDITDSVSPLQFHKSFINYPEIRHIFQTSGINIAKSSKQMTENAVNTIEYTTEMNQQATRLIAKTSPKMTVARNITAQGPMGFNQTELLVVRRRLQEQFRLANGKEKYPNGNWHIQTAFLSF